ncbi:MAG: (Fe-S)-binding protein [Acidobacteriia bacterium]|nr:(Fe-S)-binding protein [Terriglobia bacterium]
MGVAQVPPLPETPGPLFPELASAEEKFRQCIQCGVCSGSCPMGEAMDFAPRRAVKMLLEGRFNEVVESNTPWLCVSCHTCAVRCPSQLQISDGLFPALRAAVMAEGKAIDQDLQKALQNTYLYGNPMGISPKKRAEWAKTAGVPVPIMSQLRRPVDVLWIVECNPSFEPRGQEISKLLARILNALGVDFAILGPEERCLGDCEWLAGERGLFEMLIERNIEILSKYKFREIIMTDPHSYRTLLKIYPFLGGRYHVQPVVAFLAQRLDQLKPLLKKKLNATITYHDSCCLGRKTSHYEEPRMLLRAIPGVKLVEMVQNRESSLCCGGGASTIYLDRYIQERVKDRLADRRVMQAAATGAETLAVACPFEPARFEDAVKVTGNEQKLIVRDIIELLAESMEIA